MPVNRWSLFILTTVLVAATMVDSKTLHLNATKADAECSATSYDDCSLMSPKYWEENMSPENGDVLIMQTSKNLIFQATKNLALSSLTTPTPGSLVIKLLANLEIEDLNGSGYIKLEPAENATIYFGGNSSSLEQVKATLKGFSADSLAVFNSSLIVLDELDTTSLTLSESTFESNGTLHTNFLWVQNASPSISFTCGRVWIEGHATKYEPLHQESIFGANMVIDELDFGGALDSVLFAKNISVGAVNFLGTVEQVFIGSSATLNVSADVNFNRYIGELFVSGSVVVPSNIRLTNVKLTAQSPGGAFYGNVIWQDGEIVFPYGDSSLTINGDVQMQNTEIHLGISASSTPGRVNSSVLTINGHLQSAEFYLTLDLHSFVVPPKDPVPVITYHTSLPANISGIIRPSSQNLSVQISATEACFVAEGWAELPVSNTDKPAIIVLGVVCGCLVLALIVVVVVNAKKRREGDYKRIQ